MVFGWRSAYHSGALAAGRAHLQTLDAFCDAMLKIAAEAETHPELLREAPHTAPLRRLDEATAARKPVLRW